MTKINISAVSYTNTKPFLYGLQQDKALLSQINLAIDIPSVCAQKLINGTVDLGLVPVAALLDIPGYQIVSDFCIGARGPVNSVFIFSDVPVHKIRSLRLDDQSRTSNNLARVLLRNYWKQEVSLVQTGEADAFVQIGDRTFGKKDQYPYVYDLAQTWYEFTGIAFAFAVWASNKTLSEEFTHQLNKALAVGVANRGLVADSMPRRRDFDLHDYLTNAIDYRLDEEKKSAIRLFHQYINGL